MSAGPYRTVKTRNGPIVVGPDVDFGVPNGRAVAIRDALNAAFAAGQAAAPERERAAALARMFELEREGWTVSDRVLREKVARLRAALERYGQHALDCEIRLYLPSSEHKKPCSCGWSEQRLNNALAATPASEHLPNERLWDECMRALRAVQDGYNGKSARAIVQACMDALHGPFSTVGEVMPYAGADHSRSLHAESGAAHPTNAEDRALIEHMRNVRSWIAGPTVQVRSDEFARLLTLAERGLASGDGENDAASGQPSEPTGPSASVGQLAQAATPSPSADALQK